MLYYPNVMVEWYPNTLVVSTLWPVSVSETINVVEFLLSREIVEFEREYVEAAGDLYGNGGRGR